MCVILGFINVELSRQGCNAKWYENHPFQKTKRRHGILTTFEDNLYLKRVTLNVHKSVQVGFEPSHALYRYTSLTMVCLTEILRSKPKVHNTLWLSNKYGFVYVCSPHILINTATISPWEPFSISIVLIHRKIAFLRIIEGNRLCDTWMKYCNKLFNACWGSLVISILIKQLISGTMGKDWGTASHWNLLPWLT